jgi:membrane associated rhomboid family serine protease
MVFGTSVSYSVAMMRVEDALPTVGLSGIVMGMIAMLAYFMPTAKVRCFYWFIVKIGTVAISAWILALFFIGVDVYTLLTKDDMGGINLIAHVSGAVIGFVLGVAFFRGNKRAIALDH